MSPEMAVFVPMGQQPPVGQDLLIIEVSRSHPDTPQSVGLLWTSNQTEGGWQRIIMSRIFCVLKVDVG